VLSDGPDGTWTTSDGCAASGPNRGEGIPSAAGAVAVDSRQGGDHSPPIPFDVDTTPLVVGAVAGKVVVLWVELVVSELSFESSVQAAVVSSTASMTAPHRVGDVMEAVWQPLRFEMERAQEVSGDPSERQAVIKTDGSLRVVG
jgi:hypothetical protein